MLVDIEFRPNGDPIIGLANRHLSYYASIYAHGDVLPTDRVGQARWEVDTASDHYSDDMIPAVGGAASSDETHVGALDAFPRLDSVIATGTREYPGYGGLWWYDNERGGVAAPEAGVECV